LLLHGLAALAALPATTGALTPSPVATATAATALIALITVERLAAGMLPLTVLLTWLPLLRWWRSTFESWWRCTFDMLFGTFRAAIW
jgi:hypothetical protein